MSHNVLGYSYQPVNMLKQVCVDHSWVKYIGCYGAILCLQASFQLISEQYVCQFTLAVTKMRRVKVPVMEKDQI